MGEILWRGCVCGHPKSAHSSPYLCSGVDADGCTCGEYDEIEILASRSFQTTVERDRWLREHYPLRVATEVPGLFTGSGGIFIRVWAEAVTVYRDVEGVSA